MSMLQLLPTEVHAVWLSWLDVASVKSVRSTCRRFREASNSDAYWSSILRQQGVQLAPKNGSGWFGFARRLCPKGGILRIVGTGSWQTLSSCMNDNMNSPTSTAAPWAVTPEDELSKFYSYGPQPPIRTVSCAYVVTDVSKGVLETVDNAVVELLGCQWASWAQRPVYVDQGATEIDVFDTPAIVNDHRVVVLRLRLHPSTAPERVNQALNALAETCSTLIFCGSDSPWKCRAELVPIEPNGFSTHSNTPTFQILTSNRRKGETTSYIQQLPLSFKRWVLSRCSSMDDAVSEAQHLKPLAYRSCGSLYDVGVEGTVRIMAAKLHLQGDAVWTGEMVTKIARHALDEAREFYVHAMREDVNDRQNSKAHPLLVPLESDQLASLHDHYFYAALRKCGLVIQYLCGTNAAAGQQALEVLKREISQIFRVFWKENASVSYLYCADIFKNIFGPVSKRFVGADVLRTKHSLKSWYQSVRDRIEEYEQKARGPRAMDVLWELMTTQLLPDILSRAEACNTSACVFRVDDLRLVTKELDAVAQAKLEGYRFHLDKILNKMQRGSALYTSIIGTEWEMNLHRDAANELRNQIASAREWDHSRQGLANQLGLEDVEVDHIARDQLRYAAIDREITRESSMSHQLQAVSQRLPNATFSQDNCVLRTQKAGWGVSLVDSIKRLLPFS